MGPWSCWYAENNEHADSLDSLSLPAQCPLQWFLVLFPLPMLKPVTPRTTSGNITFPTPILIVKFLQVHQWNWSYHALYAVSFPAFAAMVTTSYYYHTCAGSIIRTLPPVSVDNIYIIYYYFIICLFICHQLYRKTIKHYWISSISFLTVLPQSLHANLSSALVYTFYFRALVQTLRCGPSVGTLQSSFAPPSTISQERVRSTTTFHDSHFGTTGL